jgi:hypothetical protein
VPRRILLLTLIATIAATGCGDDGPDPVGLSEAEACKAVKEHLDAEGLETRFGKPSGTQDFFGDKVISYERGDETWQFQLTEQGGTFRALRVEGQREQILPCR